MSKHVRLVALAVLVVTGAGCPSGAYYYDPYAYDSSYWYAYDSGYYYSYYDPYYDYYYFKGQAKQGGETPVTAEALAMRTAMAANTYYSPASCVNGTSSGATATIVLTGCETGPLGIKNVSGTLTATFQLDAAGLAVTTSSSGLTLDGRAAEFNGTGSSTSTATGRTFTGNTSGMVTGRFGTQLRRTSQIRIDWVPGSGCATINGSGSMEGGGNTLSTQLMDFQKCRGQCPTAGTLTLDATDRTVTVRFDGTDNPDITSSDSADTGTLDLSCESP